MSSRAVFEGPAESLLLVVVLGFAGACAYDTIGTPGGSAGADSGDDLTTTCVPRQAVFCGCVDGSTGVQTCNSDGTFGACDCEVQVGPPGGHDAGVDGQSPEVGPPVWEPTCTSERFWTDFEDDGRPRGSSQMVPGGDCVGCHQREGGPRLAVGGTVFGALHDRDNCFGIEDVLVRVIAADGTVWDLRTNGTGNFSRMEGQLQLPYTASVIDLDGTEHLMLTPQTNVDCNTCHSLAGAQGASGRIVLPAME